MVRLAGAHPCHYYKTTEQARGFRALSPRIRTGFHGGPADSIVHLAFLGHAVRGDGLPRA
jgi:hypothetical protein